MLNSAIKLKIRLFLLTISIFSLNAVCYADEIQPSPQLQDWIESTKFASDAKLFRGCVQLSR